MKCVQFCLEKGHTGEENPNSIDSFRFSDLIMAGQQVTHQDLQFLDEYSFQDFPIG
jgi:hypothetical protein